MHARLIATIALATIALATVWLARQVWGGPHAEAPRPVDVRRPDDPHELQEMKGEVMALRSELARLDHRLASPPAGAPADPAATPAASPEERKQAALHEQRRAVAFLASRVADGPRDAAWSSEIQATLLGSLEAGSGAALRSVECGASLCRAELTQPDRSRLDHFIEALPGTLHRSFQLFFERDGDRLATTVFLARDGEAMPNLAAELRAERAAHPARVE
jgi:hypothetical protein